MCHINDTIRTYYASTHQSKDPGPWYTPTEDVTRNYWVATRSHWIVARYHDTNQPPSRSRSSSITSSSLARIFCENSIEVFPSYYRPWNFCWVRILLKYNFRPIPDPLDIYIYIFIYTYISYLTIGYPYSRWDIHIRDFCWYSLLVRREEYWFDILTTDNTHYMGNKYVEFLTNVNVWALISDTLSVIDGFLFRIVHFMKRVRSRTEVCRSNLSVCLSSRYDDYGELHNDLAWDNLQYDPEEWRFLSTWNLISYYNFINPV